MPSPKTLRVSPVSRSRTQTSMSVGVRALAAVRELRAVRGERPAGDEMLDLGVVGDLLGPASAGIEQVELVELVAVRGRR